MLLLLTALLAGAAAAGAGAGAGVGGTDSAGAGGTSSAGARLAGRHAVRGARGGAATLHCTVLEAQDTQVSWVRSRDLQILAHGGAVFTADARVSAGAAGAAGGRRHWLRLAPLRDTDAGRYECQLNTEPKQSLFIDLQVLDPADPLVTEPASTKRPGGSGGSREDQHGRAAPHTDVMQRDEAVAAEAAAAGDAARAARRHVLLLLLLCAAAAA